jgi:hypothetical protein
MEGDVSPEHLSVHYRKKALPLGLVRSILRRQQQRLYELYASLLPPDRDQRVLDLGVNGSLAEPQRHFFEWNYPFREQIVAAGLEEPDLFRACFPEVEYVQVGREERLPFAVGSFDVVFCSAVVEHVGNRERQAAFVREIARVGRAAFVTTPNRWYPVELHTVLPLVHWLPTRWYRALLRRLGFGFFAAEENLNLLDRRSLAGLVPPGVERRIYGRRFLGLTANLVLVMRQPSQRTAPAISITS